MKEFMTLALLIVSWLLWSGHFEPLMLSFGLISCGFVYYLLHQLEVIQLNPGTAKLLAKLPGYLPWLFWQILLSNLAVAKVLWRRDMKLSPAVEQVRATQNTP